MSYLEVFLGNEAAIEEVAQFVEIIHGDLESQKGVCWLQVCHRHHDTQFSLLLQVLFGVVFQLGLKSDGVVEESGQCFLDELIILLRFHICQHHLSDVVFYQFQAILQFGLVGEFKHVIEHLLEIGLVVGVREVFTKETS